MKKSFIYALWCATALLGATSFTSCASDDEIVSNPDYNPETNSVKTEFTISLPNYAKASNARTRMTADDVQANNNFLGIHNFKLFSFKTAASDIGSTAGTSIDLSSISASDDMVALTKETDNTQNNAKLYTDIEIEVETKSFLLYGEANNTSSSKFSTGSIVKPTDWTVVPSSYTFSLEGIANTSDVTDDNGKAKSIVTYLNSIASATGWNTAASDSKLGKLYKNFTTMHTGSSASIQAAVQDLYHSVFSNSDAVSKAIKTAILATDYASDANSTGDLTFKDVIGGYPANLNLPDGAAVISWSEASPAVASVVTSNTDAGNINSISSVTSVDKYVYPASLYYLTKSDIKTSNTFEKDHYVTTSKWADILAAYANDNATVQPETRSVVIKHPLQYAVGRLAMKVKAANNSLYDAKGNLVDISSTGLNLTGVIIGSQPDVNCMFEPKGTTFDKAIYDKLSSSVNVTATEPTAIQNNTLVFESGTGDNKTVKVALEFENNTGKDFEGVNGIIPAGTKFYLIASLDPSGSSGVTNSASLSQVFKQDYVTTVELTISQGNSGSANTTGLGGAYNVIPDLRNTALELGLAVNLEWKAGIKFQVEI